MDGFQTKTLVTRRSLRYTYYVSPSRDADRKHPALLFVHGFPDSAHLWSDVLAALADRPNKMIVPDCLGYAGTDKPIDTSLYAYDGQADDLADILAAEGEREHETVIIGHDWGSALVQRTSLRHRALFRAVVLLNTGYMVPSAEPFDLQTVNALTEQAFGYPQFSYWELFTAPDGASVIDSHLDRMWMVLHGDVDDWMRKMFCTPGAMRAFLLGSDDVPLRPYAQEPSRKDRFLAQFRADGFASALQMYKATVENLQRPSDIALAAGNLAIDVPLLFVMCTQDAVCRPEVMSPAKAAGLVPLLQEVTIESAHWSPMEKPGEIATHIRAFVDNL
ncbi:epoxide hydrolase [Grosmannia clavigera kw1407]|uniref:Epoxide hydrolase n=1 Tax=Grosmannia clavigera (strain kw1407 / UAMH 11150) TaxID=655863 RepID=F0X7A7_GROCL|nr:epoxide hydrolase [Grosmannia clavigera kw1407]EFX06688.1 epoxide hydrolase [Grosmannia clavigera kw1407]